MTIDRIGGINPLLNTSSAKKAGNVENFSTGQDSISVSRDAKEKATIYFMNQVAQETPDIREDRVKEVMEKMKDPNYFSKTTYEKAADAFLSSIGM